MICRSLSMFDNKGEFRMSELKHFESEGLALIKGLIGERLRRMDEWSDRVWMSSDTCLQELVSPSPVTKASVESFHNHSSRGEFTNPSEFRSRAAEIQEITIIHKGFEMSNSSLVSRGPSQFLRGEAISLKWPIKIQWRLQVEAKLWMWSYK